MPIFDDLPPWLEFRRAPPPLYPVPSTNLSAMWDHTVWGWTWRGIAMFATILFFWNVMLIPAFRTTGLYDWLVGWWGFGGIFSFFLPTILLQWLILTPLRPSGCLWLLVSAVGGFIGILVIIRLNDHLTTIYQQTQNLQRQRLIVYLLPVLEGLCIGTGIALGQWLLLWRRIHLSEWWLFIVIAGCLIGELIHVAIVDMAWWRSA